MNILNLIMLDAAPAAGGNGGAPSGILMIVAVVAIFYFFMIRPQSKRQKELKKQREAMQKGDKVITAGGIHGRIAAIDDNVVRIQIAPDVVIKVSKDQVYPYEEPKPQEKKEKKEKK